MFNVYAHEKRLEKVEHENEEKTFQEYLKFRHLSISFCIFIILLIEEREKLALNYKERVKRFIAEVIFHDFSYQKGI